MDEYASSGARFHVIQRDLRMVSEISPAAGKLYRVQPLFGIGSFLWRANPPQCSIHWRLALFEITAVSALYLGWPIKQSR